mgnify:CR=1 FL=1|jgi:hypothetical protein
MFEYCVLTDKDNYGTVVKADGPKQYQYDKDRGWVRSRLDILVSNTCNT